MGGWVGGEGKTQLKDEKQEEGRQVMKNATMR